MYSVGLFYAWDFLWWIVVTLAYSYSPELFIRERKEYVLFFLRFFSIIFTVFLFVINFTEEKELTHMLFWVSLAPMLFVFHLFYPFKSEKRNQHFSFFLFFISGYVLALRGLILVGFLLSNM